jgi:hypothetical protein
VRHLPRFLLILSGLFFAAGLTSYVTSPSLSWAIVGSLTVAAVLFVAGLVRGSQGVRRRIPPLQTFAMRLRPLYEEGKGFEQEVSRLLDRDVQPSSELWARLQDWDRRVWQVIEAELPEQGPVYRGDVRPLPQPGAENWPSNARSIIGDRLSRLAGLLHEARHLAY